MATPTPSLRMPHLRRAFVVPALLCAGTIALLAGCAGHRPPPQSLREQPQPPLAGKTVFFSGAIVAEAKVSSFNHNMPHADGDGGGKNSGTRSSPPSGGGGHMGPPPGGGGGGMGGGFGGGSMGGGPGAGGPPPGGADADSGATRPRGGGFVDLPRQTLRISFTNTGTAPIAVSILELNSLIGNFAPQPAQLAIAPGATEPLLPVSGDAGGLLNWLDLTLTLRSDGKTETKVLHLVPTGEPAEAAPPPPHAEKGR